MSCTPTSPDKLQVLRDRMASATTPAERVEATLALAEEIWLSDPIAVRPLLDQVEAEADAAVAVWGVNVALDGPVPVIE